MHLHLAYVLKVSVNRKCQVAFMQSLILARCGCLSCTPPPPLLFTRVYLLYCLTIQNNCLKSVSDKEREEKKRLPVSNHNHRRHVKWILEIVNLSTNKIWGYFDLLSLVNDSKSKQLQCNILADRWGRQVLTSNGTHLCK